MTQETSNTLRGYFMRIEVAPGHVYAFPAEIVAINRAEHYKGEFGDSLERSLEEDTIPLFLASWFEADDWRRNNMDWADVQEHAVRVPVPGAPPDFDEGWVNGKAEVFRQGNQAQATVWEGGGN
jgi:hypothetical protein